MPVNFTYRGARYTTTMTNPIKTPVSEAPAQIMGNGLLLGNVSGDSPVTDTPSYKPVITKGGSLGSSIGKKLEGLKLEAKKRKPQNIKFSI